MQAHSEGPRGLAGIHSERKPSTADGESQRANFKGKGEELHLKQRNLPNLTAEQPPSLVLRWTETQICIDKRFVEDYTTETKSHLKGNSFSLVHDARE